ncbi:hypothetical protein SE17_16180 [Kouleothrix aurantiaca]|uniref:Uncharacterized protein n=1 Tax=Kouleothrix aurantiaca TaxID=186479 RepID=A0A0P9HCS3_9CHLR|nr:hypothetical protein SE17_16180 [Kouleothrix aurantiaca]
MASTLKDKIKARTTPAKGQAYAVGADLIPTPELPEQAGALSEPLQVIARNYLNARRRSGEALLDAARWLSEARATAQHGEWLLFLEATGTSTTTSDRLLDIHAEATRSPQFAERVASNWLTFTAAAEIAAPSTPESVKQELLSAPESPSRADVQKARREFKFPTVGNLPEAPTAAPAPPPQAPEPPSHEAKFVNLTNSPEESAESAAVHAPTAPAHEVWRDALLQFRGAKAQARAVQLQAKHFVGQQRRTLLEEIESLQKGLEAARKALEA